MIDFLSFEEGRTVAPLEPVLPEPPKEPSNPFLSKASDEWYTDSELADMGHELMGGIDLDPASSALANETIRATRYFTEDDNGLMQPWNCGRLWLNAPGTLVPEFWRKFVDEYLAGTFKQGLWIGFNIQQLQTLQNVHRTHPLHFPFCVPHLRRQFFNPLKPDADSPTHANFIAYAGPLRMQATFKRIFSRIGDVVIPARLLITPED